MSNLKDIRKGIDNEDIAELTEFSLLMDTIGNESVDISLMDFEVYFLPFIIGELEHNEENSTIFFHNYKKLAKGFRTPLYVISDGEVIYKLPPLILSNDIDNLEKVSFKKIVNEFINVSDNNPMMAERLLSKKLDIVSGLTEVDKDSYDFYVGELRKIHTDYADRSNLSKKLVNELIDKEDELEEDFIDYY